MSLSLWSYRTGCFALKLRGQRRWRLAAIGTIAALSFTAALIAVPVILEHAGSRETPDGSTASPSPWAPSLWWKLGSGFAIFMAGVAGNLVANALQSSIDAMPRDALTANRNHHLASLVGESVRVILLLLVDSKPPPDGMAEEEFPHRVTDAARGPLADMAAAATDFWRELVLDDDPAKVKPYAGLHEPTLSRFIIDPKAPAMDGPTWQRFLNELYIFTRNKTGRTGVPFANPEDRDAAAAALGEQFGRSFRESLKWSSTHDGLGWAAMQLQIAGQLLERSSGAISPNPDFKDALKGLQEAYAKAYEEVFAKLERKIEALAATSARHHRETLARLILQHTRVMSALRDLDRSVEGVQAMLGAPTRDVRTVAEGVQGLHDKFEGMTTPANVRPTDNLTAAGAVRNDNFVGRAGSLDGLAALINREHGPTAVAIVAGAGFGKTELARQFIHVHARTAPAGADASKLAPDQWTARWWIDGSKDGEAASLRTHYETITGRTFPDGPCLAPGADPQRVRVELLASMRNDIAVACSTGRQLLVIDNAESPEQILQYKPANKGRLIATTRRQPIADAVAKVFTVDVLSGEDACRLLVSSRRDLCDAGHSRPLPQHAQVLAEIATHLGHHALALAYAAAALGRVPHKSPDAILQAMTTSEVGAPENVLTEFGEDDLGTQYRHGLARSLGLLLDELADSASPDHDELALDLAFMAAFCAPNAIPISLFTAATGEPVRSVEASLRALHARSIVSVSEKVSMHRLTQSALRQRCGRMGDQSRSRILNGLLAALARLMRIPAGEHGSPAVGSPRIAFPLLLTHATDVLHHARLERGGGQGDRLSDAIHQLERSLSMSLGMMMDLAGQGEIGLLDPEDSKLFRRAFEAASPAVQAEIRAMPADILFMATSSFEVLVPPGLRERVLADIQRSLRKGGS